jgi:hypothetical protein
MAIGKISTFIGEKPVSSGDESVSISFVLLKQKYKQIMLLFLYDCTKKI